MMNFKSQKVLIIAPHPDDEVFGCGGLIHRCKREGGKVFVLFLTVGTTKDFSRRGGSTQQERLQEIRRVAAYLRYDGYALAFPGDDQHLRLDALPQKDLIHAIERGTKVSLEKVKPTLVLTTLPNDYNQDHRAASAATTAATRPAPPKFKRFQPFVLQYELPYVSWTCDGSASTPNVSVTLTARDLAAKKRALRLYASQLKDPRSPLSLYAVSALARLRGTQAGADLAEAYVAKRVSI